MNILCRLYFYAAMGHFNDKAILEWPVEKLVDEMDQDVLAEFAGDMEHNYKIDTMNDLKEFVRDIN